MNHRLWKDKTTRFLLVSLIMVVILCVLVFSFLAVYMNHKSIKTINDVGTFYMTSTSKQISMHFETTINLRLSQLAALVKTISSDRDSNGESFLDTLSYHAKARGFESLALYSDSGVFQEIYGGQMKVIDQEPFLSSLRAGNSKVAVGLDKSGNKIVLFGVSCAYPMEDGGKCTALVAGLPVSYIGDTLALEKNDDNVYSYIIRGDGSFVIRYAVENYDNYFERIRMFYDDVNGKTAEIYLEELKQAIQTGEDYTTEFMIRGERRRLYCTKLVSSEWYLITFMPYESLDVTMQSFTQQWIWLSLSGGAIILLALMLVFVKYFRLTHRQLNELTEARKAAEQASRAKSEFLSNMSHDIRTPMNAIIGMTSIAVTNIENPQQIRHCLQKIALSSKHLLGLINDVLDMSKIESGKMTMNMEWVSLQEVMDGIVSIAQPQINAKKQQFHVHIHDIISENVYCDSVRLNQVLLNLISNAIKFTPDGGSIWITLCQEASPKGEGYVRVRIQVRDTGIGMPPEFKDKIFESFSREDNARVHHTEGSGLGMAISKYIVDAMGGTIEVESEQGVGTEFQIILDLEKAEAQELDMILPDWNMLVVDDDRELCESTVAALESIGIRAEWTLCGEDAVKMAERRHERGDDYQIILLDWKLPTINGIETARRIRHSLGDDVPILLISAYDWSEIEEEAREVGINGFISKPLFRSTLFHGLKQFAHMDEMSSHMPEEEERTLCGKRILLSEDNELNWEIAHDLLSELGLELEWAENGKICVEKFSQSPEGFYDAILMDIRMPVMNGYEATRAIRAMERGDCNIPIIAMTADAFVEDAQKCLECGMNAHAAKPIDVREISRMLQKYLL